MITIGNKLLRKRWLGTTNISEVYRGITKIWPHITDILHGDWVIELSSSKTSIAASGETVTITSRASRQITYVWVNYAGTTNVYYKTYETEYKDCTLSSTIGTFSGNNLTIPANGGAQRTITVTASYGGASKSITLTQGAGLYIESYGDWTLSLSASPSSGISSNGGTSTITVDCHRIVNWSDGNTAYEQYDGNVSLSTDLGSLNITSVSGNYGKSTLTLGGNSSTSSRTATIDGEVTVDGTRITDSCTVSQLGAEVVEPEVDYYGDWTITVSASPSTLDSDGGDSTITATCSRTVYWTEGKSPTTEYSSNDISLSTDAGSLSDSSVDSNGGSSTLTLGANTGDSDITATITASCEGVSNTCTVTVSASGETPPTEEYGDWELTIVSDQEEDEWAPSIGGSDNPITLTVEFKRKNNITGEYEHLSGGSIGLSIDDTNYGELSTYSVGSPGTSILTLTENRTSQRRYITITASIGNYTASCVVKQSWIGEDRPGELENYLTVHPVLAGTYKCSLWRNGYNAPSTNNEGETFTVSGEDYVLKHTALNGETLEGIQMNGGEAVLGDTIELYLHDNDLNSFERQYTFTLEDKDQTFNVPV